MFERVTYLLYTVDLHDVVVTLTCFRDGLPGLRQTMVGLFLFVAQTGVFGLPFQLCRQSVDRLFQFRQFVCYLRLFRLIRPSLLFRKSFDTFDVPCDSFQLRAGVL